MAKKNMACEKPRNSASDGLNTAVKSSVVSTPTASTSSVLAGSNSSPLKPSFITAADGLVNSFTGGVEMAASAVDAVSSSINRLDCSSKLYNYIMDKLPFSIRFAMMVVFSGVSKAQDAINEVTSGNIMDDVVRKPEFIKKICAFVEKWGGTIDGWIDVIVKSAFALFNKIDAARERLETATLDFTEAVRLCIIDVIDGMTERVEAGIQYSLAWDWESLAGYMLKCPCLTKVIANLTGCTKDEDGNSTLDRPMAVIACIQKQYSFIGAKNIKYGLDSMVSKYIKDYINGIVGLIEAWVVYVFNLVIKPFRWLMKKYVQLLTTKMDVTAFIDKVGPFECLMVYTKEYKGDTSYYGMSALDMINTYRGWIGCLEVICPSLSEKIKTRTKELYKDLRLEDKYWRRAMEADIYTCCLASELKAPTARESVLRQLYQENPWDWLMSMFRKTKNKDDNTSEAAEEAEQYDAERPYTYSDFHEDETAEPSPLKAAITFTYASDTENEVLVGPRKISKFEETSLKSIVGSMSSQKDDSYYIEHMYQLVRFSNNYATSNDYVNYVTEKLDEIEAVTGDYSSRPTGLNQSAIREPYYANDPTGYPTADGTVKTPAIVATYEVKSDYSKARSEKLMGMRFTSRRSDESLAGYYARMYQMAGV